MMKFACFERTVEALYKFVVPKPRADCTKSEQLVVTFVAGYIGEFVCFYTINNEEQLIQEFALDGVMMQVGLEVIRRVCSHSNMTGCQLHECFCYNRTIRT